MGPTRALAWIAGLGPALDSPRRRTSPWRARLTRAELGAVGEELAARFLLECGLKMLGRNIPAPEAELDLVARDGEFLVVVEVKTGWYPRDAPEGWKRPRDHVSAEAARIRRWAARRIARDLSPKSRTAAPPSRFEIIEVGCGRRRRSLGSGGVVIERLAGIRDAKDAPEDPRVIVMGS